MRHTYIPRNSPTLNGRTIRSLANVARERSLALENAAIVRHSTTQTAVLERERTMRAVIAAIEAPRQDRQTIVRPSRVGGRNWSKK